MAVVVCKDQTCADMVGSSKNRIDGLTEAHEHTGERINRTHAIHTSHKRERVTAKAAITNTCNPNELHLKPPHARVRLSP